MKLFEGLLNRLKPVADHTGRDQDADKKGGLFQWLLDRTGLDEMLAQKAAEFFERIADELIDDTLEPVIEQIVTIARRQTSTLGGEFEDFVRGEWEVILDTVVEPLLISLLQSLATKAEAQYPQLQRTEIDEAIVLTLTKKIASISDIVADALDSETNKINE